MVWISFKLGDCWPEVDNKNVTAKLSSLFQRVAGRDFKSLTLRDFTLSVLTNNTTRSEALAANANNASVVLPTPVVSKIPAAGAAMMKWTFCMFCPISRRIVNVISTHTVEDEDCVQMQKMEKSKLFERKVSLLVFATALQSKYILIGFSE